MCKLLLMVMALSILGCASQKKEILIDKQEILYDSTRISDKLFKITVITTLKYKNDINFTTNDLENFYMLADEDTLDLKLKNIQKSTDDSSVKTEYITLLKHREVDYDNKSFISRVENWQIKNRNTNITLKKSPNYRIVPLIALWDNNNPNKIQ